jgi:NAD(P)-dependent dehydrogenase (short-subunit alcohol dehydrogenase family)
MNEKRFDGKVAVVTGSSHTGIGHAIAEQLASEGARVVLNARGEESLAKTVAEFEEKGYDVLGIAGDIVEQDTPGKLVDGALERWGRIDHLVANVGVQSYRGRPSQIDYDAFVRGLVGNSWLLVGLVQAGLRAGLAENHGSVVAISAVTVRKPAFPLLGYHLGNSALEVLAKSLAVDLGADGVRVNVVAPGVIVSSPDSYAIGMADTLTRAIPLGRLGLPADIAEATLFLLSDAASYITGQVVDVDGGSTNLPREFLEH